MAFDPLTWALGFGLNTKAKWILDQVAAKSLGVKLGKAAGEWASELPTDFSINPEALFAAITDPREPVKPLAQQAVHETLAAGIAPTDAQWAMALEERWRQLKEKLGVAGANFFQHDFAAVEAHLLKLAVKLATVCRNEEPLFRATVLAMLQEDPSQRLPAPLAPTVIDVHKISDAIESECNSTCEVVLLALPRIAVWVRPKESREKRAILSQLAQIAALLCRLDGVTTIEIGIGDTRGLERQYEVSRLALFRIRIRAEEAVDAAIRGSFTVAFWKRQVLEVVSHENATYREWTPIPFEAFERQLP